MRKFRLTIICICLLFLLAGCANAPAAPADPEVTTTQQTSPTGSTETSVPTTTGSAEVELNYNIPMSVLSMPLSYEQELAGDGTVLFTHGYQNVSLILQDADVADAVVIDLLNKIDENTVEAYNLRSAAQAAYSGQANWSAYESTVVYNPIRFDRGVLSLLGSETTYDGSRTTATQKSVTYDLVSGKRLLIQDITADGYSPKALATLVIEALAPQSSQLFRGYEDIVSDTFGSAYLSTEAWYLTETGLCFYFSPYEIAPNSAGIVTAEIPYNKLVGILDDAYFPAEQFPTAGSVLAASCNDMDINEFNQFAEVNVDAEGEQFLLHTDGVVGNLRIERGTWNDDATVFTPVDTVMAVEALTAGDALVVHSYFSDVLPSLRLRYTSGGVDHSFYIIQSGMDGSIQLTAN